MNRYASLVVLSLVLLVASPLQQGRAQSPLDVYSPIDRVQRALEQIPRSVAPGFARATHYHPGWGVEFQPVPQLLRLHCPLVRSGQGLLVARVDPDNRSPVCRDLRAGDVLLSINDEALWDVATLPESPSGTLRVMRAGEEIAIQLRPESPNHAQRPNRRRAPFELARQLPASAAIASAFASDGESVAVAQQGDQITLEMSLPSLESAPIRFQGTREEILQQLEISSLSPAAKQRVRQSLP